MLKISKDLFDLLYPVGSYYETSNTSWTPSSAGWYGTWSEDTKGRVTVAQDSSSTWFSTVGKNIGSDTKSYKPAGTNSDTALSVDQIPSHQHNIQGYNSSGSTVTWTERAITYNSDTKGYNSGIRTSYTGGGKTHTHTFTGTASTINVIQASVVVKRWHRTA